MTKKMSLPIFPFSAIIGQEEMKLALQLNVIDPKIGGVMIMGDRGTGKSTTIRAIADLLPKIEIVKNDSFNSDPPPKSEKPGADFSNLFSLPNKKCNLLLCIVTGKIPAPI